MYNKPPTLIAQLLSRTQNLGLKNPGSVLCFFIFIKHAADEEGNGADTWREPERGGAGQSVVCAVRHWR